MKFKFFRIVLIGFLLIGAGFSSAQAQQIPTNIDQLSDEQLIQYLGMANSSGMSEADIEAKARQKGLSDDQIQKLKQRIQRLNLNGTSSSSRNSQNDTADFRRGVVTKRPASGDYYTSGELKIFGSDLFSRENLTFEPNLQIPTPKNYLIGTGDQINIDLYGYSDANFKLKVSPEGTIRIPNSGPVKIAGLSFDDAQQKIKSQLTKIYPQIASGKTSVQVSLGQIRSIRVTLVGEIQQPGTYTLPSLATIANALYVSGGPNKIGSYRNIELVRNGKVISKFDLYEFLMKGDLTKNLRLEDEDIVRVSPYEQRVYLNGAIKRKAIYEAKNGETLQQLLNIGGGINETGYKDFVRIVRSGKNQKEAVTVSANQFNSFLLQSGDSCYIDSISNRFKNRIVINGAVFHPGVYSTDNYPTLKDLIQAAAVTEEAYLQRGILSRKGDNYLPKMLDFNVQDILGNKNNFTLQQEDSIKIFSILELRQKDSVYVNGEVNKPGSYRFIAGMNVNDLILVSGGFKESATGNKIEISRRNRDTSSDRESESYSIIKVIDINKDLNKTRVETDLSLEPFDIVSIRKNPNYRDQIKVRIEGEVMFPGDYTIESKAETLTDLIKRAGGFKSTAYVEGAILLRNTFQDSLDASLLDDKIQSAKNLALNQASLNQANIPNQAIRTDSISSNILINSLTRNKKIVGIKLDKAIENPHSADDIPFLEGDILRIPIIPTTVQSFGAVYVPKKIIYRKNLKFKDVVDESGGFLTTASTKKSYVIYPNGEISSTSSFLWFRSYPKIKPGAEVYVPLHVRKTSTQEVVSIGVAAASVASLLISMVYLLKSF